MEICSTFMVVQLDHRTGALQKFAAAFKGDKVQQLLMQLRQEDSGGQSSVGRKVQPVRDIDAVLPLAKTGAKS